LAWFWPLGGVKCLPYDAAHVQAREFFHLQIRIRIGLVWFGFGWGGLGSFMGKHMSRLVPHFMARIVLFWFSLVYLFWGGFGRG
jgi:hypothetical protein